MSKPQQPSSLARSLGKSEELFHKHVKKGLIASHHSKTHVQAVEAKLNAAEKRGGDQGGATPKVAIDICHKGLFLMEIHIALLTTAPNALFRRNSRKIHFMNNS